MCTALYSAIFIKHCGFFVFFFFTSLHSLPNYHCNEHTAWRPAARVPIPAFCQHSAGARGRPCSSPFAGRVLLCQPLMFTLSHSPGLCLPHAADLPLGAVIGGHTLCDTVRGGHRSGGFTCYLSDHPLAMTTSICGAGPPRAPLGRSRGGHGTGHTALHYSWGKRGSERSGT